MVGLRVASIHPFGGRGGEDQAAGFGYVFVGAVCVRVYLDRD
jgi:hypothetical protein